MPTNDNQSDVIYSNLPGLAGTIVYPSVMTFTILDGVSEDTVAKKSANKYYNNIIGALWIPVSRQQGGEIGLEIECEGANLFMTPIQWWTATQDGSLRAFNGHMPVEYTLKEPISRSDLNKAFDYLERMLKSSGSLVVESPRCSVHVHLNCQKYTIKQVINFILCYLIVEDFLVEWCGHERVGNLFCLRAKDAHYFIHLLRSSIITDDYSQVTDNEMRYMSCNAASLRKFGSLEFRSMRGTVDFREIGEWVDVLRHIRDQSLTFDNPQEIIRYFDRQGVDGILQKILPLAWYDQFKYHPEKSKIVWDNVRNIREIAYAIPEWEKAEVKPKKEKTPKKKKRTDSEGWIIDEDGFLIPIPEVNSEFIEEYDEP